MLVRANLCAGAAPEFQPRQSRADVNVATPAR
jgi:hypothetical protein